MENIRLKEEEIQKTLKRLYENICEAFPSASLQQTCQTLYNMALEIPITVRWICRRNYLVTLALISLSVFVGLSLIYTWKKLNITLNGVNIADFAQMFDSSFSFLFFLGSGFYFLFSYESRARKKRLIQSINKLIGLAHVIESHQLSKDPDHNPFKDAKLLAKYLNYCTDMLALSSKIGFLYVQALNNSTAQSVESELEALTSGISRKIWQKIMIVKETNGH